MLSLVPSLLTKTVEREKSVASMGWELLEHIAVASSTIMLEDPLSYPYPLPPFSPKHWEAHGSGRRSSESAEHLHFGGPREGIYLPWQRHRQLSSGRPVPLPPLPQPSPSSSIRDEHISLPTGSTLALRPALQGEQPRL